MTDLSSVFAQGLRKPTMAELLMKQGVSTASAQGGWGEGLARALMGGMAGYMEKQDTDAEGQKFDQMFGLKPGAPPAAPSPSPAPAGSPDPKALGAALQSPAQKIYSQDERNPLDPPLPQDRDLMIRTIHAEAGNQGPDGQRAVASVIRNRTVNGGFGGDTVPGVIKAPNQFEPVNTPQGQQRMAALQPGSPQYAAAGKAVDQAYAGDDPTNGATNFYAPKAQAALGRNTPAWAQGPGQDIGDHRFYGSPQVAQNDPAAIPQNAMPTQGGPVPGAQGPQQRQAPQIPPDVLTRARSLWTSGDAQSKAAAMSIIQPYLAPKDQFRAMTPEERRARQVAEGVPADINTVSGEPKYGPIANSVNVNTVANPVLEGVGKQVVANREKAEMAVNTIPVLHEARKALDEGAITGAAADWRVKFAKLGSLFGMDASKAVNSEVFIGAIGREVLAHAKSLGPNPSNTDRDYIKDIEAGNIKLEEGSIRRLLDISEKQMRNAIKTFNSQSERLMAADPNAYKSIAPLMNYTEPGEYKTPEPKAAPAATGDGWVTHPSGVRIREKR